MENQYNPWIWVERTGPPLNPDTSFIEVVTKLGTWKPLVHYMATSWGTAFFLMNSDRDHNLRILRRVGCLTVLPIAATLGFSYSVLNGIRNGSYVLGAGHHTYVMKLEDVTEKKKTEEE